MECNANFSSSGDLNVRIPYARGCSDYVPFLAVIEEEFSLKSVVVIILALECPAKLCWREICYANLVLSSQGWG